MAIQINNEKGFLLIETSREEIKSLNPFNLGVCDSCNIQPDKGVYIAVLNSWYCLNCYHKWYISSQRYNEDIKFEENKFKPMYNALMAQCN